MNFSISSSEAARILLAFALPLLLLFGSANMALKSYVLVRTTQTAFTQEIGSKAKHMMLNKPEKGYDLVLAGNSRTEYGISSAAFAAENIHAYNYGVAGAELGNYAYMLEQAAQAARQDIVLSLRVDELYDDSLSLKPSLHLTDVKMLAASSFPAGVKLTALGQWLLGFNAVRIYADQVNAKIRAAYRKFDPRPESAAPQERTQTQPAIDCPIIKQDLLTEGLISYKCENGDFVMTGQAAGIELPGPDDVRILSVPNPAKLDYLRSLAQRLKSQSKKLWIVLEPAPFSVRFDREALHDSLAVSLIDYSALPVEPAMWGDDTHLNAQGRLYYSAILAKKLRPLLQDPEER